MNINVSEKSNFIWRIADLLRGDYKQSEYGDVILPFTVLCRLNSVLAPTKDAVMALHKRGIYKTEYARLAGFRQVTGGLKFYNISEFTFAKLKDDAGNIADNLTDYIKGFSENARTILESFDIYSQIARLDKANLLYLVVTKFVDDIDLHPDHVSNNEMGYIFEELIRKFSEMSNETAGEHFTPREVIRLMVSMLFTPDMEKICEPGFMAKLYDPAAGTGGMLSAGIEYAAELNDGALIEVYGQELNEKTYAICKSDTMIKGKGYENIHLGNSFTDDKLKHETFHYMLCNPPFGVEWKKYEKFIRDEAEDQGYAGRFGAGLPRVSDGSLLFLQHMISKMMPVAEDGCRIGIVFNGSPLFTGDAGSGESEIRRWIIENGWLETIIALPDQLFYNTGILTYVWIVTNRKKKTIKDKVLLIDGTSFFERMRKPLGEKRKTLTDEHIKALTGIYGDALLGATKSELCKIFNEDDFAYWKVTVERPLRLNFQASTERIERIREQTAFANLATSRKRKPEEIAKEVAEGQELQEGIVAAIGTIDGTVLYKNRTEFSKVLSKAIEKVGLDVKTPLLKAILAALSEKDETADICTDAKGNPEPDPDLRDTEQIPFKEDITVYIEREVKPYAPDAWVDDSKTKKGYEIPFTRHFYKYTKIGDAEETLRDIQSLGAKIQTAIAELFGEV
ncbi:N-6 DNA methylase [Dehalobacter sp. TBBPA1]|uniref:type I restriction-modification system subunit M n=1 Tax=Dehalobacter sp. TBBPA1 TaxID=3235037 RepID=UPI0034A42A28